MSKPEVNPKLILSKEEIISYGYKVVDTIVEHFETQNLKSPVFNSTRKEMDALFLEEAPENVEKADEVLDFVIQTVLKKTDILSHPKAYSFVPGPSNYKCYGRYFSYRV